MKYMLYLTKEERFFDKEGNVTSKCLLFEVMREGSFLGTVEMSSSGSLVFDLNTRISVPLLREVLPQLEEYLNEEGE